jgi:hypothetical protein
MAATPDPSPLQVGDYLSLFDRSPYRRAFFQAIRRRAPEVLLSLRRDVLPIFKQRTPAGADSPPFLDDALLISIFAWAARFNLVGPDYPVQEKERRCKHAGSGATARAILQPATGSPNVDFFQEWVRVAAYGTLRVWSRMKRRPEDLDWTLPVKDFSLVEFHLHHGSELDEVIDRLFKPHSFSPNGYMYKFRCAPWNPTRESRQNGMTRILSELKAQLELLMQQTDNLCRHFQLNKATKKVSLKHFDWLVYYQIQRRRFGQIASACANKPDRQTVADGVKDAAELVIGSHWQRWLRPGSRGRPSQR